MLAEKAASRNADMDLERESLPESNSRKSAHSEFKPLRDSNPSNKIIKTAAAEDYGFAKKDINEINRADISHGLNKINRQNTSTAKSARDMSKEPSARDGGQSSARGKANVLQLSESSHNVDTRN